MLCWGVLMHIPDADRAIGELTRVAKPGGVLVVEEINQHAPESSDDAYRVVGTKKEHHNS